MQKLNLTNISEAPENKDFWVVGTANREGSIDSNSYKKNLAKIGGNLEDMTANMTTEQKMQARKNLGLYHESTEQGEKTAEWTGEEFVDDWAKISDDTPAKSDIVGLHNPITSESTFGIVDIDGGYEVYYEESGPENPAFKVITEGSDAGIYVNEEGHIFNSMSYNGQVEVASKIDGKYLPSHVLELTNVPTVTFTVALEELSRIGLTAENIKKICGGEITHFKQTISSGLSALSFIYPIMVRYSNSNGVYQLYIVNMLPELEQQQDGMVLRIIQSAPGEYRVIIKNSGEAS